VGEDIDINIELELVKQPEEVTSASAA